MGLELAGVRLGFESWDGNSLLEIALHKKDVKMWVHLRIATLNVRVVKSSQWLLLYRLWGQPFQTIPSAFLWLIKRLRNKKEMAEWLRPLIFTALNCSSSHRCGFEPSSGHV